MLNIHIIVGLILSATTTVLALKKMKSFQLMTSSTGQEVCAVDDPTEVEWLPLDSLGQCGMKCIVTEYCKAYNFNRLTGKCDKYCNVPTNYRTTAGCSGHVVICKY